MSSESSLNGTPRQIEFDGNFYAVHLLTGRVKATLEQKLKARAQSKLDLRKQKARMSGKEYQEELRLLDEKEERGEYSIHSGAVVQAVATTEWGRKLVLELLMPETPKEVLERLLDERSDKLGWLILDVLKESMPETAKRKQDGEEEEGKDPPFPEGQEAPATPSTSTD